MKKKELCTHPLDGRARLLDVQDHQSIIIERCTKCMRPEWVLEGREGIDYPKKFTQEEVDVEKEKTREVYRITNQVRLQQLQKEIEKSVETICNHGNKRDLRFEKYMLAHIKVHFANFNSQSNPKINAHPYVKQILKESQSNPKNDKIFIGNQEIKDEGLKDLVRLNRQMESQSNPSEKLRSSNLVSGTTEGRDAFVETCRDDRPTPVLKGESAKRFRKLTGLGNNTLTITKLESMTYDELNNFSLSVPKEDEFIHYVIDDILLTKVKNKRFN